MEIASADLRRARPLLGCFVEIAVSGSPRRLQAAVDGAFSAIAKVHRLMSFHDPDSDVSRLNQTAAWQPVRVNAWTLRVLQAALDLHRRSVGIFDVAVAPALQARGLLPCRDTSPSPRAGSHATSAAIEFVDGDRVRFRDPGVRIDLGGIAKGFAVDCAVDVLRGNGVAHGLVNAGGDLRAFGAGIHAVDIRDPRVPERVLCVLDIQDEALASSGGRFDPYRSAEIAAPAIVDPHAGDLVRAAIGASVRAPSCMMADALTKIVMLAGDRSAEVLSHYRAGALRVAASGEISVTSGWNGGTSRAA